MSVKKGSCLHPLLHERLGRVPIPPQRRQRERRLFCRALNVDRTLLLPCPANSKPLNFAPFVRTRRARVTPFGHLRAKRWVFIEIEKLHLSVLAGPDLEALRQEARRGHLASETQLFLFQGSRNHAAPIRAPHLRAGGRRAAHSHYRDRSHSHNSAASTRDPAAQLPFARTHADHRMWRHRRISPHGYRWVLPTTSSNHDSPPR